MNCPKVLVTGANGFVGEAMVFRLMLDKQFVHIAAARAGTRFSGVCQVVPFGLGQSTRMPSLKGVDVVTHCAAKVHVMNEMAEASLATDRRINVDGAVSLARNAVEAGVGRFIFISSIKVNGEQTDRNTRFKSSDVPAPVDFYAISKFETEIALQNIGRESGMGIVIIRPPLVYGPGVKANFLNMMRWINYGVLLPLGSIKNKRSLVALANLVDLVVTCITKPAAAGQFFLVSDGEDLSTTQLLQRMAFALGKPSRLLPLPAFVLKVVAFALGKSAIYERLCGSLQVYIRHTQDVLGWTPPSMLSRLYVRRPTVTGIVR